MVQIAMLVKIEGVVRNDVLVQIVVVAQIATVM